MNNKEKHIKSELYLILNSLKEILLYVLLLIPYLIGFLLTLISGNKEKRSIYVEKIFTRPFKIIQESINWFFEAKVTAYLIILLIIIYIFQVIFPSSLYQNLLTHPQHLFEGNFYSIFTSIFLHADIIHLGTNLLALLIFGRAVEQHFQNKTLYIFLFSGVFANIVSNLISFWAGDAYYSLGASGAIAGLIMFAILLEPLRFSFALILPLPLFIIGWGLISLDILGVTNQSDINHLAHLGGYSALLLIFFFLEWKNRKKILKGFSINLAGLLIAYLLLQIIGIENIKNLIL